MKIFEQILYHYGPYVLSCVRNVCEQNELYEECRDINSLLGRYSIDPRLTTKDWIVELSEQGLSGQIALENTPAYFLEAIQLCKDKGMFNKLKKEVLS